MKRHLDGSRGFTLIELMIVIAIIATIASIAIPGMLASQRAANERNASTSLKSLASAEADFKFNDRDGNKVPDYWTRDVAGLYCMTSAAVPGFNDEPLKLIELSLALADSNPGTSGIAGSQYRRIQDYGVLSTKSGYWYLGLYYDGTQVPLGTYWQDTGGLPLMDMVHNSSSFGFCAYPDVYRSTGTQVFMINEQGTVMKSDARGPCKTSTLKPPGWPLYPWYYFPTDAMLKQSWSKLD